MKPTIGRIVHYILTQDDVERSPFHPAYIDGNPGYAGEHFPAIVCVITGERVNLQVFLDGSHSLWVPSAIEGTENGTWHWPEREE
jgi:hypothetical protein